MLCGGGDGRGEQPASDALDADPGLGAHENAYRCGGSSDITCGSRSACGPGGPGDADVTKRGPCGSVSAAPVFRPTSEEFADAAAYIRSIAGAVSEYGICKIIPPEGWAPPNIIARSKKTFTARLQSLHNLKAGKPYRDGQRYSIAQFRGMADNFVASHFPHLVRRLGVSIADPVLAAATEAEYWRLVSEASAYVYVEYGNDNDTRSFGSGFPVRAGSFADLCRAQVANVPVDFSNPAYYLHTGWNLANLPVVPESVLRYVREPIEGINVPWIYFGMIFSTFAWHAEDNHLFSANYMHFGEVSMRTGRYVRDYCACRCAAEDVVWHPGARCRRFRKSHDLCWLQEYRRNELGAQLLTGHLCTLILCADDDDGSCVTPDGCVSMPIDAVCRRVCCDFPESVPCWLLARGACVLLSLCSAVMR